MGGVQNVAAESEKVMAANLRRDLTQVGDRLRRMADTIERIAAEADAPDRSGSYADLASRVQHEVLWGVANLALDRLTREAYNLDLTHFMATDL